MVGCMVATLAWQAPAMLVAQRARIVDLDGRCCSHADRPDGLCVTTAAGIHPPTPALWDKQKLLSTRMLR